MGKLREIVIDADHPAALARFWAAAVDGYAVRPYDEDEIVLAPGDMLLLYTDGITEAMDAAADLFGKARLKEAIAAGPATATAEETVNAIIAAVKAYGGGTPQADDLTVVAVKRNARYEIRNTSEERASELVSRIS